MADYWKQSVIVRPRGDGQAAVSRQDAQRPVAAAPAAQPTAKSEKNCRMRNYEIGAYQRPVQNCYFIGTQRNCTTSYERVPYYGQVRVCD